MFVAGQQEDITERKLLEERIRNSEARFRTLVDSCPDGIAVHRDGRLVHLNRLGLVMLGYADVAEVAGKLFLEIIHRDDIEATIATLRQLSLDESNPHPPKELRLMAKDGSPISVEMSSVRLNYDGAPAVISVIRNISERKRMQAYMAQADRMASLGTLAAGVAHEINNPLSFVATNIELMTSALARMAEDAHRSQGTASSYSPTRYDELLELAKDAFDGSMRIKSIVTELRLFSRVDDQPPCKIDVTNALEIALKMTAHELRQRARIVREIGAVPAVLANEGRLSQVFVNLLLNAVQAIEPGKSSDNEIRVVVRSEGRDVVIEVSDTGVGIQPEHLPKIFDPFFTTKPVGVGSGLGLPICLHILQEYQGQLQVTNNAGCGTLVTVRLPARDDMGDDTAVEPLSPAITQEQPALPKATTRRRHRALIIDDEPAICRVLQRALSGELDTITVMTGEDALIALEKDQTFTLVLCDLMMFDVSGQDVYERITAKYPHLAERFVFMTGGATNARNGAFLQTVANPVLEKPVSLNALQVLLRNLPWENGAEGPRLIATERRRAQRVPGLDVVGFVQSSDVGNRWNVIDHSACGIRFGTKAQPRISPGETVTVLLRRRGDASFAHAQLELARTVETDTGTDLCFHIRHMDSASRQRYQQWLLSSSPNLAAAAHPK